ncbi:MAG: UDP-N-acetylglucosamine 1-carboxyvinyltransferase, partial [Clostridia bacterium]|nr:UDP-N-acetylglucosamine 1-carboxyvinyltransferase [Clostridia bacterium]
LPILAASLLPEGTCVIHNVPDLSDTRNMCALLKCSGADCVRTLNGDIEVTPTGNPMKSAPFELACKLRASFLIIGPILARYGKIKIPLPGGCQIGARPIDLHLKGFAAMGAKIKQGHGYVEIKCPRLEGAKIYLDFPSVGATENIMTAACLADGEVIIENAANEPEIIDLANFLRSMGAEISGDGTDTILVKGKQKLHPCRFSIIPDRIEAGTFMVIAAACRGRLKLENAVASHLGPVIAKLKEMGFCINANENSVEIFPCDKFKSVDIKTLPYPGFPTDMQAQFMSLMSIADGTGVVVETVFENRFMQVPELLRMGANIKIDGRTAVINGTRRLSGAQVRATDLRAGAALVIAALSAQGPSEISDIEHIERGYENFVEKLSSIGVKIKME